MGINECIDVWAQRENVPISEWKVKLLSKVKTKLEKVKKKNPRKVPLEVLKDPKVLEDLKELHSKFIFVPVDKSSNNISLVCKQFYYRVLLDELGLIDNVSQTYELLNNDENHLVQMQKRFLNSVAP